MSLEIVDFWDIENGGFSMECQKSKNAQKCPCQHTECSRHGVCCECLRYHLSSNGLPACCFPDDIAKTDERSFSKFVEINS